MDADGRRYVGAKNFSPDMNTDECEGRSICGVLSQYVF